MEKDLKAMDDKQAEVGNAKKTYETPTLTKLGTVEQLTQGAPPRFRPDNGSFSN